MCVDATMAFSSVLPFLLSTHSVDCAVPLLLCHLRALLFNSALFLQFTALIVCPFDGPLTALSVPFSDGTLPFCILYINIRVLTRVSTVLEKHGNNYLRGKVMENGQKK